jgi:hypothetical protein
MQLRMQSLPPRRLTAFPKPLLKRAIPLAHLLLCASQLFQANLIPAALRQDGLLLSAE